MSFGVGVIGCGNIAPNYLGNAKLFADIEVKAVADLNEALATSRSVEFGIDKNSVDQLLARDDIEVILNLTPPVAHASVTRVALAAGKHVYSEKPLATNFQEGLALKNEAERLGLSLAVAPDTFLGASHQLARRIIDNGDVGRIVGGAAFFLSPGMESWHPNPGFFFKAGGGPLFDMAPYYLTGLVNLLGPIERVVSMSSAGRTTRLVTAEGPMSGKEIPVEVPTTFWSVLAFRSGAQVSLGVSWDVQMHTLPHIELYGSEGSLRLADPDQFGGTVHVGKHSSWQEIATEGRRFGGPEGTWTDHRILGLVDMVIAIAEKREPRASVDRALHVLEAIESLTAAAVGGKAVVLSTSCERSAPFDSSLIRLR
ncbi:Gfo/Idh/MocA family protein [Mesorhizobium sophorae]|uniref:Gfo/Idh/MocA family protein n=1 Tax=Mesorhizobium sophorae TaxID=1300294 RepID=UPI000BA40524|nr:Gfo/Idh/MocA family oxidoreductase [Mesorhizobium sophorae]